jgi:hypothetical protein
MRELVLIDFGLSKLYLDGSKNHKRQNKTEKLIGCLHYASINSHNKIDLSRRDDLISLIYSFIYMFFGKLPWNNISSNTISSKMEMIKYEKKMFIHNQDYDCNIMKKMKNTINYLYELEYDEKPNYFLMEIHINNILDHTKQQWDDMLSVNLTGPYLCCKAVIPHMITGGKGKIINFGSIASFMGRPDRVAYVAAKTGVLGLTRALAVDLTGKNININTICPGLISTPFNQKFAEDPELGEVWGKETIVGRWGKPSDIAGAAIFLSSDDSDFINGSEIKIDGGWLAAKTRKGEITNDE